MTQDIPNGVIDDITRFRYRQRFKLSYVDASNEPDEAIEEAVFIWDLDNQRAKLEKERQRN